MCNVHFEPVALERLPCTFCHSTWVREIANRESMMTAKDTWLAIDVTTDGTCKCGMDTSVRISVFLKTSEYAILCQNYLQPLRTSGGSRALIASGFMTQSSVRLFQDTPVDLALRFFAPWAVAKFLGVVGSTTNLDYLTLSFYMTSCACLLSRKPLVGGLMAIMGRSYSVLTGHWPTQLRMIGSPPIHPYGREYIAYRAVQDQVRDRMSYICERASFWLGQDLSWEDDASRGTRVLEMMDEPCTDAPDGLRFWEVPVEERTALFGTPPGFDQTPIETLVGDEETLTAGADVNLRYNQLLASTFPPGLEFPEMDPDKPDMSLLLKAEQECVMKERTFMQMTLFSTIPGSSQMYTPEQKDALISATTGCGPTPGSLEGAMGSKLLYLNIGPRVAVPRVHEDNLQNARQAAFLRIYHKRAPFAPTRKINRKIENIVKMMCEVDRVSIDSAPFAPSKIHDLMKDEMPDLESMMSKKWSPQRKLDALLDVLSKADPYSRPKIKLKVEPMPKGKPARIVINVGDQAQILSLWGVWVMEKLFFKHRPADRTDKVRAFPSGGCSPQSVKGRPRRDVMNDMAQYMRRGPEATCIEHDVSSFDAGMGKDLLNMITNTVLAHIIFHLAAYEGICPHLWGEIDLACRKEKTIKLKVREMVDERDLVIRMQQKSGDRSTGIGNTITTFTIWTAATCGGEREAIKDALDKKNPPYTSIFGCKIHRDEIDEGDDAFVLLRKMLGPGTLNREEFAILTEVWRSIGMVIKTKVVNPGEIATFCGHQFLIGRDGPTDTHGPDIPRLLSNISVSSSRKILDAYMARDRCTVMAVVADTYFARAMECDDLYPTLAAKIRLFACEAEGYARCHDGAYFARMGLSPSRAYHCLGTSASANMEREAQFRAFGDFDTVRCSFKESMRTIAPNDRTELINLQMMGYPTSATELDAFRSAHWSPADLGTMTANRTVIPASWLPEVDHTPDVFEG
jgi:hypothetical protein